MDEQTFWKLELSKRAADEEGDRNDAVFKAVSEQLTQIARQHYPRLGDMDRQGLREVGEIISRAACSFTVDLGNVVYHAEQRQDEARGAFSAVV